MAQQPWTRDAIVDLLRLHPDGLTKREIAEELDRTLDNIISTIRFDRNKNGSERFRIIGYRRGLKQTGPASPVFGLGPGRDSPRPKPAPDAVKEAKARYRERNRAILRLKAQARDNQPINPFLQLIRP